MGLLKTGLYFIIFQLNKFRNILGPESLELTNGIFFYVVIIAYLLKTLLHYVVAKSCLFGLTLLVQDTVSVRILCAKE